ncbi:hypothetical protein TNCV_4433611 [Trichonephila clavipes]|nr:hypothetical protein TNCV_4433611 [Trichonephila clavipes]
MNGDEYPFTDESRFSLSSVLIAYSSESVGSRNHPSNIIKRQVWRSRCLVWEASCLVVVQTFTSSTQVQLTDPLAGRRLAARTLPPVTIQELRLSCKTNGAAMPQQLIDTLILSMGRRCEKPA